MKRYLYKLTALSICLPTFLSGLIFRTDEMTDLLPYLTEHTLVVLDMDSTLVEPAQQLDNARDANRLHRDSLH